MEIVTIPTRGLAVEDVVALVAFNAVLNCP